MNYPYYLAENLTPAASVGNLRAFVDLVERNVAIIMNNRDQTPTVKWLRIIQLQAHITRAVLRAGGRPHDLFILSQNYLERMSRISVHERNLLKAVIVEYSREAFANLPKTEEAQFGIAQRFLRSLEEFPLSELSVQALAKTLSVTPSYLSRAVRDATGSTPRDHIRTLKLTQAKQYLSSTSVTRAALDAGFGKVSTFIALFRREFGETPRTYKRRIGSVGSVPVVPNPIGGFRQGNLAESRSL